MKNFSVCLATGLITLLAGCSNPAPVSENEKLEITGEIEELLSGYPDAVKRKDLDWYHNFWYKDKDFVIAGDG